MKWKLKQDFSVNLPHSRCSCIHPSVFLVCYIKFYSFGFPLRTPFCLLEVVVPRFLSPYSLPPFWKNLHICAILITWSAVCQGLLKTRRHIESREDPGYEVGIIIAFNSRRIGWGHQHGRHFIVWGHQHGGRDFMWNPRILTGAISYKHPKSLRDSRIKFPRAHSLLGVRFHTVFI